MAACHGPGRRSSPCSRKRSLPRHRLAGTLALHSGSTAPRQLRGRVPSRAGGRTCSPNRPTRFLDRPDGMERFAARLAAPKALPEGGRAPPTLPFGSRHPFLSSARKVLSQHNVGNNAVQEGQNRLLRGSACRLSGIGVGVGVGIGIDPDSDPDPDADHGEKGEKGDRRIPDADANCDSDGTAGALAAAHRTRSRGGVTVFTVVCLPPQPEPGAGSFSLGVTRPACQSGWGRRTSNRDGARRRPRHRCGCRAALRSHRPRSRPRGG